MPDEKISQVVCFSAESALKQSTIVPRQLRHCLVANANKVLYQRLSNATTGYRHQGKPMNQHTTEQPRTRSTTLLVFFLLYTISINLVAGNNSDQGIQLYRWVDDQGNVNYTDRIPPSEINKERTELSEQGTRVRTIPPAKSSEQIQRERELVRLRAQQQRLIQKQKAEDNVLLRTFRSVDDLTMVRDGKLSAVDVMIQVAKSNIRRQQDWLTTLRTEAAELERAGEPVTDQLKKRIAGAERALDEALATVLEREQQKQAIREKFARDLKRFQQLKDFPEEAPTIEQVEQPPELPNLIKCNSDQECEQVWRAALTYVREHTTMPIETSGANVMMTKAPVTAKDIGLTLTRIQQKEGQGALIFLDLQCRNYSASANACNTESGRAVLDGFRIALGKGEKTDR